MLFRSRWILSLIPESAKGNMNKCIKIDYVVLLTQNKFDILGGGEKREDALLLKEDCSEIFTAKDVNRIYPPGKGTSITIEGFIDMGYLRADQFSLHANEGKKGNRFTIGKMLVINDNKLVGTYKSNISDLTGKLILVRQ